MPLDNPRIEELRRRVQADPASIAFAQLAEEYRRAGSYDEAVKTCRLGLARHPGYLSARVTLSRALIELDALDEAQHELEFVLRAAPENLAAIRGMAEIHHRRGQMPQALDFYRRALEFARHDPELEETVAQIARELGDGPSTTAPGLSFEEAQSELLSAFERMPASPAPAAPAAPAVPADSTADPPPAPPVQSPATPVDEGGTPGDALAALFSDLPASAPEPAPAPAVEVEAPATDAAGPQATGAAPGDQTFDFDALLSALGEAQDRPAPKPVEALLSTEHAPEPASSAAFEVFDLPAVAEDDDPLASIEKSLRDYEPPKAVPPVTEPPQAGATADEPAAARPAPVVPASAVPAQDAPEPERPAPPVAAAETRPASPAPEPEPSLSPTQQAIVDDLEQWLEEIVLHRGDSRS